MIPPPCPPRLAVLWRSPRPRSASPAPSVASRFDFNVGRSLAYYNGGRAAPIEHVRPEAICARRPGWHIVELPADDARDKTLTLGGERCALNHRLVGVYNRFVPWQSARAL